MIQGQRLCVAAVGDDDAPRVEMLRFDAVTPKRQGDDGTGKAFAEAGDFVPQGGSDCVLVRDLLNAIENAVEVLFDHFFEGGAVFQRSCRSALVFVELAQLRDSGASFSEFTGSGKVRHGKQLIGCLPHGGDDHQGLAVESSGDDARDTLDRGRRFYRGAAELHDDHGQLPSGATRGLLVSEIIAPTGLRSASVRR